MKKTYISPAVLYISSESSQMICASNDYSVTSGTTVGADTNQSQYGNDDWVNQGNTSTDTGGFPTVSTDGDDGDMESRSKSSLLWDW